MGNEDYAAVALLEVAVGAENLLKALGRDDFQIKDIWGIYDFLKTNQSYYFVGSRGSGKTTLVTQAVHLLGSKPRTILFTLSGNAVQSIGEGAESETIRKFITVFFGELLEQIEQQAGYKRIARISSVYAAIREWADFRIARRLLSRLTGERRTSGALEALVKSHLRLSFSAGPLGVSLLEAGPLKIGRVAIPLQLTFNATPEADRQLSDLERFRENLNAEIGSVESVIEPLVNEIANHCKKHNVDEIMVLCDDFHLLSVASQVRILHFLRRVVAQLEKQHSILMILKIFSATNLSPYIKGVLGLKRELMVKRIDSSLENLEQKRQAVENLLVLLLKRAGWSDDRIRRLFRREVIDLLLVLSGGHPRRFLEMAASLIKVTKGSAENLYHDVMFAAAKVLKEYRNDLAIHLGIDGDPHVSQYKQSYDSALNVLTDRIVQAEQGPFFVVPHHIIEANAALCQWLDDAIVVGDLLEIVELVRVGQNPCKLLALNPSAVYLGNQNLKISYQDISEIQMNARALIPRQISES